MAGRSAALLAATVFIGAGTSVQVTVNARVGKRCGISSFAAVLNLTMGVVLLSLLHGLEVANTRRSGGSMAFLSWRERPAPRHLAPGLCGLAYVLSSVFLQPTLGSALFMVCIVTGQLGSAATLDHVTAQARLTVQRAAALLLACVGAVLTASDRLAVAGGAPPAQVAGFAIVTLCTGALMVLQAHLSRAAAALLPSRLASAWWSFIVSALTAWVVFAIQAAAVPGAKRARFAEAETWRDAPAYSWTAAFYGVAYIASSIIVPRTTGSGAYFVALVMGQLLFDAVIDTVGLFDSEKHRLTAVRGVGLAVVVVAAAGMQIPVGTLCGARKAPLADVQASLLEEEEALRAIAAEE